MAEGILSSLPSDISMAAHLLPKTDTSSVQITYDAKDCLYKAKVMEKNYNEHRTISISDRFSFIEKGHYLLISNCAPKAVPFSDKNVRMVRLRSTHSMPSNENIRYNNADNNNNHINHTARNGGPNNYPKKPIYDNSRRVPLLDYGTFAC